VAEKRKTKSAAKNASREPQYSSRSIYSVNEKYRAELLHTTDGWICRIWKLTAPGSERPLLANLQPFQSSEEAVHMAQEIFARYTGDDRYFSKDDILKANPSE
jgi:hypothetical protein